MDPNFNTDPGASAPVSRLWGGARANQALMGAIAGVGAVALTASALLAAPGADIADFGVASVIEPAALVQPAAPANDDDGFSLSF